MKTTILSLFTLISLNLYGQSKHDDYVIYYETIQQEDVDNVSNFKEYNYKTGEPIFIVVNVQGSIHNSNFLAEREQHELAKNFNIKTDFINHNAKVSFTNKYKTNYNFNYENDPSLVIYWSGKFNDKPIVYDQLITSTEFFSKHLKKNYTSSYIDSFNEKYADFTTDFIDNPTEESDQIAKAYLNDLAIKTIYNLDLESFIFNTDFKGIKMIKLYQNNNLIKDVTFDPQGILSSVSFHSDDDDEIRTQYIYFADETFRHISTQQDVDLEDYSVFYKDNELYIYRPYSILNIKPAENNFITYTNYFVNTDQYYFTVSSSKINQNIISYTEDDHLNDKIITLNSTTNYFPYTYNLRGEDYYTCNKLKNKNILCKSDDVYQEYIFNNKDQIIKMKFKNNYENIEFDYVYEYY